MSISAVVATLNEEGSIDDCLETLTWCDEIVIVDNDSSDNTVLIAEEYTDQIYQYEERHGYGDPLKRYGVERASHDWILIVDADEMIPVSLAQRLQRIAKGSSADVVEIPFRNYSLGIWVKGAGWWPDYHPRFFRRDAVTVTDEIHGYLNVNDGAEVIELPASEENYVVHFNHIDLEDKLARLNTYTTVETETAEFSRWKLLTAPPIEFFNRLVLKRGYRLGWHGLLLSILQAWYRWLVLIKRWEQIKMGGKEGIKEQYDYIRQDIIEEWENE